MTTGFISSQFGDINVPMILVGAGLVAGGLWYASRQFGGDGEDPNTGDGDLKVDGGIGMRAIAHNDTGNDTHLLIPGRQLRIEHAIAVSTFARYTVVNNTQDTHFLGWVYELIHRIPAGLDELWVRTDSHGIDFILPDPLPGLPGVGDLNPRTSVSGPLVMPPNTMRTFEFHGIQVDGPANSTTDNLFWLSQGEADFNFKVSLRQLTSETDFSGGTEFAQTEFNPAYKVEFDIFAKVPRGMRRVARDRQEV